MDNEQKYDSWHQHHAETEAFIEEPVHPWHVTVARLLPDLQGQRVLEVGCGRGDFAIWLADKYPQAEVVGVDFSEVAIATAERRAATKGSKAVFRVDDSEALSFADHSFDYVISCECMEHVIHPVKMASEIYRVLRPGGKFILTTENYFNGMILQWLKTWTTGKPFDSGSGVQPHENFFLFWRVRRMLERGGLKVSRMESNYYQWLLLPRTDPMKLVTFDFKSPFLKRLFRPFGRHFTFCGIRPLN
jgi:ubiquinone/menaquinone biosynthesis C-methylase UbiE